MTSHTGIIVAANGARRTTRDHPAVPVTIKSIAETAANCRSAGAGGIHLHVRDSEQQHVLDAAQYKAAIAAIRASAGQDFAVQITTEAVGRYQPAEQIQVVHDVHPEFASVGLREIAKDETQLVAAEAFYHWAHAQQIGIQHILYEPANVDRFFSLVKRGVIPGNQHALLFVLGRHAKNGICDPNDLTGFMNVLEASRGDADIVWSICAFGITETASLAAAIALGGHARVGFENSVLRPDGSEASDNAEQVERIAGLANTMGFAQATPMQIRRILGTPS